MKCGCPRVKRYVNYKRRGVNSDPLILRAVNVLITLSTLTGLTASIGPATVIQGRYAVKLRHRLECAYANRYRFHPDPAFEWVVTCNDVVSSVVRAVADLRSHEYP